jgi:hypothetical protein
MDVIPVFKRSTMVTGLVNMAFFYMALKYGPEGIILIASFNYE